MLHFTYITASLTCYYRGGQCQRWNPYTVKILLKARRADRATYRVDIEIVMEAAMRLPCTALNKLWDGITQKLHPSSHSTSPEVQELALQSAADAMPNIYYAYDPLPMLPASSNKQLFSFDLGGQVKNPFLSSNSLQLAPLAAKLPYRSSIGHVYANRHWHSNLDATTHILKLLAADTSVTDMEVNHGFTIGKLAKKGLEPGFEHSMVVATHYMFPAADKHRIALIAALMIVFFVFDGTIKCSPNRLRC